MNIGGEQPILGFVASIGFLGLLALSFYLLFSAGRARIEPGFYRPKFAILAAMAVFAFLLGTVGGLSSIIAFFTSDLRGWNRISILLALISLAAVGLGIQVCVQKLGQKFSWRSRASLAVMAAVAVVTLVGGYLDQVTPAVVPDYAGTAAASASDQQLVDSISQEVGANSKIVQFPYRGFPETSSVTGVPDTEQLKPFMHSPTLQWTSGGVKGRPTSEWVQFLQELTPEDAALSARAAGFAGILVDTASYQDQGTIVLSGLKAVLGSPVVTDQSGRYQFFTLAPMDAQLSAQYSPASAQLIGSLVVNPVLVTFLPIPSSFPAIDYIKPYKPELIIDNPRTVNGKIQVTFHIQENVGTSQISLQGPSGEVARFEAGPNGGDVTFTTEAPPGRTHLYFTVVGGTALPARMPLVPTLELVTLTTSDPELAGALASKK